MARAKRKPGPKIGPTFQAQLSKLYGKVSAYHKLHMETEAKYWATQLVEFLKKEGLYVPE